MEKKFKVETTDRSFKYKVLYVPMNCIMGEYDTRKEAQEKCDVYNSKFSK